MGRFFVSKKGAQMKNLLYLIFGLLVILALAVPMATPVLADDTGFKTPSNYSNSNNVSSPDNGRLSDDNRATFGSDNSRVDYYRWTLNIPSGATITGIEVSIEGRRTNGGDNRQYAISLSRDGSSFNSSTKTTAANWSNSSDSTYSLGGDGDLWGWSSVSSANFNDDNFRVRVYATSGGGGPPGGGGSYDLLLDSVQVKIYYTILAGITITPTSGLVTTEAGDTATFTIVLNSTPTNNVTIGLSSSDTTEGTVSPTSVTFTTGDWDTPQTVTITGVDDAELDGNISYTIITAAATSTDPNYNGVNASDVSVTNNDDDTATCDNVEVQLAIILDGSISISTPDFNIMKNGLAAAVTDPDCVPHDGSVELTVVQIGLMGSVGAALEIGPVIITEANASTVESQIQSIAKRGGYTPIACALYLAADTLHDSPCFDPNIKQAINLVTDGIPNRCCPPSGGGSNYDAWDCISGTGSCPPDGCNEAMESTEYARDYAISHLGMTANQDEIDAEFIGSQGTASDWLRDEIVWPGDGYYALQSRARLGPRGRQRSGIRANALPENQGHHMHPTYCERRPR
jgi:hypothetical protein